MPDCTTRALGAALAVCGLLAGPVNADETQWWFDVEVLLFKRNISPDQLGEQFDLAYHPFAEHRALDLLTPYIQPDVGMLLDSLAACDPEPEPLWLQLPPLEPADTDEDTYADEQNGPEATQPEPTSPSAVSDDQTPAISQQEELAQIASFSTAPDAIPGGNSSDKQNDAVSQAVSEYPVTDVDAPDVMADELQARDAQRQALLLAPIADVDTQARPLHCQFRPQTPVLYTPITPPLPLDLQRDSMPTRVNGTEWLYSQQPYLLPTERLELNELARNISRQRGLQTLLHVGWRQEVLFGQDKAFAVRLFAGQNFARSYASDGQLLTADHDAQTLEDVELLNEQPTPPVDIVTRIRDALNDPQWVDPDTLAAADKETVSEPSAEPIWELDGTMKVFLRYINRVPYLHIDSNLDFRAPVYTQLPDFSATPDNTVDLAPDRLQSFPFAQLRRVISTQLHYFDHPLFGMVVQIRRFHPPPPPEPDDSDTTVED